MNLADLFAALGQGQTAQPGDVSGLASLADLFAPTPPQAPLQTVPTLMPTMGATPREMVPSGAMSGPPDLAALMGPAGGGSGGKWQQIMQLLPLLLSGVSGKAGMGPFMQGWQQAEELMNQQRHQQAQLGQGQQHIDIAREEMRAQEAERARVRQDAEAKFGLDASQVLSQIADPLEFQQTQGAFISAAKAHGFNPAPIQALGFSERAKLRATQKAIKDHFEELKKLYTEDGVRHIIESNSTITPQLPGGIPTMPDGTPGMPAQDAIKLANLGTFNPSPTGHGGVWVPPKKDVQPPDPGSPQAWLTRARALAVEQQGGQPLTPRQEHDVDAAALREFKMLGADPDMKALRESHERLSNAILALTLDQKRKAGEGPAADTVQYFADQLVRDPQNLKMVSGDKGLMSAVRNELASRGVDITNLDSASRTMAIAAKDVQKVIPSIEAEARQLDQMGLMGAAGSRWRDFLANKVGASQLAGGNKAGGELLGKFRADVGLLKTSLMKAHVGSRGGQNLLEEFNGILNADRTDLPGFLGALNGVKGWMDIYANRLPATGAAPTGGAAPKSDPLGLFK